MCYLKNINRFALVGFISVLVLITFAATYYSLTLENTLEVVVSDMTTNENGDCEILGSVSASFATEASSFAPGTTSKYEPLPSIVDALDSAGFVDSHFYILYDFAYFTNYNECIETFTNAFFVMPPLVDGDNYVVTLNEAVSQIRIGGIGLSYSDESTALNYVDALNSVVPASYCTPFLEMPCTFTETIDKLSEFSIFILALSFSWVIMCILFWLSSFCFTSEKVKKINLNNQEHSQF